MASLEAIVNEIEQSERNTAIRLNAVENVGVNPDEYAKRRALARTFGVPTPDTKDSLTSLQLQKAATDVQRYANVPVLNKMLADKETAKLIANSPVDWDILSTTSQLAQAYKMGRLQSNLNDVLKRLEIGATPVGQQTTPFGQDPIIENARRRETAKYVPEEIAEIQRQMGLLSENPSLKEVQDADNVWDMLSATAKHPLDVIGTTTVTSVSTSPLGTVGTLAAGALTGVGGAAFVQGLSSFEAEYGSSFADQLTKHGVDLTDPESIRRAMSDTSLMAECRELASKRAGAVAVMDGMSVGIGKLAIRPVTYLNGLYKTKGKLGLHTTMGVGEKIVGDKASKIEDLVSQGVVQGAMGGLGEAMGSQAIGENVSMSDVFLESVAGLGTAPIDVISARYELKYRKDESKAVQDTLTRAAVVKNVITAGTQLPLKDRAPDVAAKAVQDIATEAGIPTVTVNAREATEELAKVVEVAPEIEAAIEDAKQSGGDIKVPVEHVYRVGVQYPEVMDTLLLKSRYTEGGISLAVAQAYDFDGQMRQSAERLFEETKKNYQEKRERFERAEKAFAPVKEELKKTGLSEEQIDESVTVYEIMTQTAADMLDMPVDEFVDKFGLRVVAGDYADVMSSPDAMVKAIADKTGVPADALANKLGDKLGATLGEQEVASTPDAEQSSNTAKATTPSKPAKTAPSKEKRARVKEEQGSARNTWIDELKGYRNIVRESEERVRVADERIAQLRIRIEEINKSISDIDALAANTPSGAKSSAKERRKIRKLEERDNLFKERRKLFNRISKLEQETWRLNADHKAATEAVTEMEQKLRLQDAARKARDNAKAKAQVELDTFDAMVAEEQKHLDTLKEKLRELQREHSVTENWINEANGKHFEDEVKKIKQREEMLASGRKQALNTIIKLSTELNSLVKREAKKEQILKELKGRIPKSKKKAERSSAAIAYKKAVKEFEDNEKRIAVLSEQIKAENEKVKRSFKDSAKAKKGRETREAKVTEIQRRNKERDYENIFNENEQLALEQEIRQQEQVLKEARRLKKGAENAFVWIDQDYAEKETLLYQEAPLPENEQEAIPPISAEERSRRAEEWRNRSPSDKVYVSAVQKARREKALGAYDSTRSLVRLFTDNGVNASTFVHESAHHFLNMTTRMTLPLVEQALDGMRPLKQGEEKLVNLIGGFMKWGGEWDPVSGLQGLRDALADWTSRDVNGQRELQEKFARGMETYLATSEAPTSGLQMMFDRFAKWLKEIYGDIRRMSGYEPLAPEVAALYDQLFTSERAVQEARMRYSDISAGRGMSLYDDLIQAGMTKDEFRMFVDMREEARMTAEAMISSRMDKGLKLGKAAAEGKIREYTRDYKAFREEARAQVEADRGVSTLNQYRRARKVEVEGKDGKKKKVSVQTKIRLDSIPETYRDQLVQAGVAMEPGKKGIEYHTLGEDAMAFGASSPEAYIDALLKAAEVDQNNLIETIAQDKFREKYDVTYTEKNLELLADRALSNKARMKVLATEVAALKKTSGNAASISTATRAWAVNKVADMTHMVFDPLKRRYSLNDSPAAYRNTAKYLARQALEHFSKGDVSKAGDAKDGQLKQEMIAEALEEARETARKFNRKLSTALRSKTIDGSFKEQIRAIAHHVGKGTGLPNGAPDIASFVTGNVALESAWSTLSGRMQALLLTDESGVTDWRLLRNGDISGLYKFILALAKEGSTEGRSAALEKKLAAERLLTDADESIAEVAKANGRVARVNGITETRYWKKAQAGVKGFFMAHLPAVAAIQILDGNKQGLLTQSIVWKADECGNKQVNMEKHYGTELAKVLGPVATSKFNSDFRVVEGAGRLNLHNLFSVVLNMGNEGNAKRLAEGNGLDADTQMRCAEQLTAEQLEAVNKVWSLFEDLRKQTAVIYRSLTGTEPNWIEPTPFTVMSADGKEVQMTGGYVPIKYDPEASKKKLGTNFTDNESLEEAMKNNNVTVTTARTYTKDRADSAPMGAVLRLDTQCIYDGFNEVIRDICWREWINDTQRVFDGVTIEDVGASGKLEKRKVEGLLDKVNRYYGDEMVQVLRDWVKNIATGGRQLNQGPADRAMAVLRSGVSLAGLGFNFTTALIQVTGLLTATPVVGANYMIAGIGDILANPTKTWKSAARMSSLMRNRSITRTREIADARNIAERGHSYYKIKETTYNVAYGAMMAVQGVVDHVVFSAALRKAYDMGLTGEDAVHYADRVVIDTQGSGMVKDSSAMENGSALQRVFMVFYSFMGRALGLNAMAMMGERDRIKAWTQILTVCMATPLIESVLRASLQPGGDDDSAWDGMDDLQKLEYGLRYVTGTTGNFVLGQFMIGREFSSMWENFFKGDPVFTWRGPSGLRAIGDVGQFLSQAQQGEWDASLTKAIINVMGDFGLPGAAQLNRSIAGWDALNKDDTNNWMSLVFGYKK